MIPIALKYSKSHEWVAVDGDIATIGITDFAQSQLGDITYVELPKLGKVVKSQEAVAVIESVKAASDAYAPVNGVIVEVNGALGSAPDKINNDPYKEGWMFKISGVQADDLAVLMNATEYEVFLKHGAH